MRHTKAGTTEARPLSTLSPIFCFTFNQFIHHANPSHSPSIVPLCLPKCTFNGSATGHHFYACLIMCLPGQWIGQWIPTGISGKEVNAMYRPRCQTGYAPGWINSPARPPGADHTPSGSASWLRTPRRPPSCCGQRALRSAPPALPPVPTSCCSKITGTP